MTDRPDLSEEALAAALSRHYGIDALSLGVVSGGEDGSASVYRVETGDAGPRYLVKVRQANGSRDVAAVVSRYLSDSGLPHVVPPIRSNTSSLTVEEGAFSFTVYPFIEGRTGVETGLVERHWRALGDVVQRLHASVLPSDLSAQLATENYRPAELEVIRQVDRAVSAGSIDGPIAHEAAGFWAAQRSEILALVERTEELGPLVERLSLPLVLCHADLHTWNVMIDGDGELWLIDWDEVVRAPKERDLMFVIGGIDASLIDPRETGWFFDGYGETELDPLALSYYRHAWAVQDIGGYGEMLFLAPAIGDERRSHDARILMGLFDSGGIVELARTAAF